MYFHIRDDVMIHNSKKVNRTISSIPMFHFNKLPFSSSYKNIITLPDPYIMDSKKYMELIKRIVLNNGKYSWYSKIEKLFWRGTPTGRNYTISNISNLPRVILVNLSLLYPHLIDAKFIHDGLYVKDKDGKNLEKLVNIVNRNDELKYFVEENHLKYKYLISVDGNVAAWKRVPWIMVSNSVLFLQHKFVQYFYVAMKPYVHYVPLKDDVSDIFEKIDWAKKHDKEVKQIADNASIFIKKCLLSENIEEDFILILNEYSKIQEFTLNKPTLPLLECEENIIAAYGKN